MGRPNRTLVPPVFMRIVGFFIRWLVTLAVIAGIVYLIGGQVWMAISLRGFMAHIDALETVVTDTARNARQCQSAPASSDYSVPIAAQLRFIDEQTYQVELICTLIETTPIVIAKGTLPMLITKLPESSGFYVDLERPEPSSLTVKALRSEKTFVFDEKLLAATAKRPPITQSSLPKTSCAGWGYQCCQSNAQKGTGAQKQSGVLDCSGSCFKSCAPIPMVVALTADPYPSNNEVLMTTSSVTVTFSYTSAYSGGKISKVWIDYGDGSRDETTESIGVFTHTYTCNEQCRYKAVLHIEDDSGNSSVESDASTLYIVRR